MAFINRFVKLPTQVYDITEEDLPVKQYEDSYAYVLPLEIDSFYPSFNSRTQTSATHVYMKSGRSCVIEMDIEQFIDVINKHLE